MRTSKTKEREVWLAVRLCIVCGEEDNPVVRGIDWLTGALDKANDSADDVAVTAPPFDLVDTAVRALQQTAREREAMIDGTGKGADAVYPDALPTRR